MSITAPKDFESATEFARGMMARKSWESMLGYVGVEMDIMHLEGGERECGAAINAEMQKGRTVLPEGDFLVRQPLLFLSGMGLRGRSLRSRIIGEGNFRLFSVLGTQAAPVDNVHISDLRVTLQNGATNQTPTRFFWANDCSVRRVLFSEPALNGIEVDRCERVYLEELQSYSAEAFGIFYHRSKHCGDLNCRIVDARVFSHEFKSCQDCVSENLYVSKPRTNYGLTCWTGFATGGILSEAIHEIPGELLCQRCGWINPTVIGAPDSEHLVYFTSSPDCFIDGGYLEQDDGCVWPPISVNATSYYNEGAEMLCDGTAGDDVIRNIVDPDGQLKVGARIHLGGDNIVGVNRNHTILALPGDGTATLDSAAGVTGRLNMGFVSRCDRTRISNVKVKGRKVAVGADAINIAGTLGREIATGGHRSTDDPISQIVLENVQADGNGGNRYVLYVSNLASVSLEGGEYKGARETQIRVGPNCEVLDNGAEIRSSVGADGVPDVNVDGVEIEIGGRYVKSSGIIRDLGLVAINPLGTGAVARMTGGEIRNIKTYAAILYDNCAIQNTVIRKIRNGNGSFSRAMLVHGRGTTISQNFLDAEGSAWLDGYIGEEPGATDNHFGPNVYVAGPAKVILAADSTSSIWGNAREGLGTAAPLTGTWEAGDRMWKSDPFATGPIGYVCLIAGTPGTWRGWGVVLP